MSVLVNILTTYNGAGAKKAMRDMAVMQKQAALSGAKMSAGLLAASAAMQRRGAAIASTGALMSKRLTLPVLAFAGASVYAAQTVDKGLGRVRAGTGATGEKLKGLEASFRKVAAGSGKDMETIGNAVAGVNTRLGLTGKPLEEVTSKFLTLSRVAGEDVSTLLQQVSRAANDAGVKSGEMAGFLDQLLVASQQTGASIGSLAGDMYRYGSPLRQVGFSLEETMATLGAFDKAGVNTKLVMGSLRIALGKMAKAGEKDLPAGLAKGIASIKNAATGGEAASKAIELFGARAGPDMAAAIREGRFEVADLIKQLETSAGAVERTGDSTRTFSGRMAVLRNKATLAGEGFGRLLLPHLEKMVEIAGRVVAWLGRLDAGTRKWILGIGLAAAVIGPVLVVVGKLMIGIGRLLGVMGKLTMAFGRGAKAAPGWARGIAAATKGLAAFVRQAALTIASLARQAASWIAETAAKVASTAATVAHSAATKASAAAQWLLNAALSANPIGLVVVAIAGLVAALVVAYKKSETFRKIVNAAWEAIKKGAVAVFGFLRAYFKTWVAGVRAILGAVAAVASFVVGKFRGMKDGVVGAFRAVVDFARGIGGKIKSAVGNLGRLLWDAGSSIISGLIGGIKAKLSALWDTVKGIGSKIKDLKGPLDYDRVMLRPAGQAIVEGLITGMGDRSRNLIRAVTGMNAALGGIGGEGLAYSAAGGGRRSTVVHVARGAVQVSFGASPSGGVTQGSVDAAIDRGFRRLAAEIARR